MRISAGQFKGKKISSAKALKFAKRGDELRPTSSKVRESIFNIVGDRIKESQFLDLYAGTGAVGIEAMSRGAKMVVFAEADGKRTELIKDMLRDCGCSSRADIAKRKVSDFIRNASENKLKFDIIFLDPPYYGKELESALSLLADGALLDEEGIVIAEHLSKKRLPDEIGRLVKKKDYKYGDTMLTLFRKKQCKE